MTAANAMPAPARSSLDRVWGALDAAGSRVKRSGASHVQAQCPLHEDRKPSLSIDWLSDRGGITKLHCHSCQASERDLLEAVGLTLVDRFDQPLPPRNTHRLAPPRRTVAPQGNRLGPLPKRVTTDPEQATPEAGAKHLARTYDYVDEHGDLLYEVLRYQWRTPAGTDKTFEQRRPDGRGGWVAKTGERKVLRHLPAVAQAIADGRQVWLVEGEKDDEALNAALPAQQGMATTNAGGAGGFGQLAEQLTGAQVMVVVDRDPAGYKRAAEVAGKLRGNAASVATFLPAVTDPRADVADHLAAGLGVDEFIAVDDEQIAALAEHAKAHDAVKRAEQHLARTQMCLTEVQARLVLADEAAHRGAAVARSDEQRYALRWAHEATKSAQRTAEAAEQTWQAQQGARVVPVPVELDDALLLGRAEQAQRTAQRLAGQAWAATGAPQPEPVQQALGAPTPSERHLNIEPAPAASMPAPTPLPTPAPGTAVRPDGRAAEVVPFPGDRRGGSGGGDGRRLISAIRPEYERIDGHGLYERKTNRDGMVVLHQVLDLDVRIVAIEMVQVDPSTVGRDGVPFVQPQSVLSYLIEWTHPVSGELMRQRIEGERASACDWLSDLGVMIEYDSSSKGRARVWDAVRATSKGQAQTVTVYESTGWNELPEVGWTYVHAGGGICRDGAVPLTVRLPSSIDKVDLPEPISDPAEIRRMFQQDSLAMMTRLPARVGAVLLGTAFRAPLGLTRQATALFGTPGTLKSAVAALTAHHFGVRWERSGAASMSGQGATVNALPILWWHAKDALFFGDDFAPDKSVEAAAQFLSTVARMQYNETVRDRYNGRARGGRGGVQQGCSTRTTLMLTSEVRAFADSGDQRLNVVDLARGDIELAEVIELDRPESRMGRATLMASLVQWMSTRYPELVAQSKTRAGLAAGRRREQGAEVRVAEPLGELEAGWEMVGDWLVGVGAYTAAERDQMLEQVRAALTESGQRSRDPDAPTNVGERVRRLLDTCLRSGAAYVTAIGGRTPQEPDALRLGWRRSVMTDSSGLPRLESRGEHIGVVSHTVHGDRLHLEPEATMGVVLAAARRAGEPLAGNKTVAQRELAAIGILRTEKDGAATRYTVPVPDPSGAGGQVRRWDLDLDRIFHEQEPPTGSPDPGPEQPPTPPMAADENDQQPTGDPDGPDLMDEHMGVTEELDLLWAQIEHHAIDAVPCVLCDRLAGISIGGEPVHFICWKNRWLAGRDEQPSEPDEQPQLGQTAQPAAVPADTPAAPTEVPASAGPAGRSTEVAPLPSPRAKSPSGPQRQAAVTRTSTLRRWKRAALVIDADAVYLGDGAAGHQQVELTGLDSIGAIGEHYAVGHQAGPGLVVLTQRALDKLGLMPSEQLLTEPEPDGQPATEAIVRTRILAHLAERQATLTSQQGWSIAGTLAPWTTIRRAERALRLVLEPFVWLWDPRTDSPSPFIALPDPEQDPAACWSELARRLDRLAELLGVPWSTSAGTTGAAVFDLVQRRRSRRGGRVLDQAGVLPELTSAAGQLQLEGNLDWPAKLHDRSGRPIRAITRRELDAASAVHSYDRRGSYLAPAGGTDLPIGQPEQLDNESAQLLLDQVYGDGGGKLPAGLWQVTLPTWDEEMPPPHPDQHRFQARLRWVSTPALRLLLDEQDAGGAGYSVADLQPQAAWVWPDQARMLEPWYRQLRDALLAARKDSDVAVSQAVKGVYTAYIGRMESELTANSARPWHHQPVWRAFIIAAARSGLWRVLRRHQLSTGRRPLAVHIDEVSYLDDSADPTVHAPAPDTGELGKLKVSGTRLLTDHARAALADGARISDERVWASVQPQGQGQD